MLRDIATCNIYSLDRIVYLETAINWNCVRHAVASIEHNTSSATRCVEREDGLDGGIERWHIESLEQDLSSSVTIGARVQRWLGEKDRMLGWSRGQQSSDSNENRKISNKMPDSPNRRRHGETHVLAHCLQFLCVDILPYPLHVVPVRNYAVLQWIVDLQQPSQLLCPRSDEDVTLQSSSKSSDMLGTADVGRKIALGQILACKARSDCSTSIVEHNGCVEESGAHDGRLVKACLLMVLIDARAAVVEKGLRAVDV